MSKLLIMFFSTKVCDNGPDIGCDLQLCLASDNASPAMSFAKNGDVNIAYRVVGDQNAEPVVMIMGLSHHIKYGTQN